MTSATNADAQRYVLARLHKGLSAPLYACAHPNGRKGLRFSSVRKPLEFSKADLVVIAPRLKLIGVEFLVFPVECIRVRALNKGYQKKLGINFRVVHVCGCGDFRHTPLAAVICGEYAPPLRCLHPAFLSS